MDDQGQNEAAAGSDGSRPPLRIAIINCPGSERYDACFKTWLRPEATGQRVEWEVFEAAEGQLPPAPSGGEGFDGYIITGSKHGVYEDFPWIQQLCDWVAEAHARRSKILGVCFGHQVPAGVDAALTLRSGQAVAKALGGTVMINPAGFEIGRYTTALSDDAAAYFQRLQSDAGGDVAPLSALRMNFVHGDYVPLDGLPSGLESMGGTALSPHNGLFNGSNVLTFQGHPEFTRDNVELCLEKLTERQVLPQRLPPGVDAKDVVGTLAGVVDSQVLAVVAMRFFRDGR